MVLGVLNVARCGKQAMILIDWLCPLLGNELRGEKLRGALPYLVVSVHHEHVVGAPTVRASGMGRRIGQVMIIMGGLPAGGKKPPEGIGQPQRSKYIHRGFATVVVSLRVQHWNPRRQAILTPH